MICDPFVGGGTVPSLCKQLNRRFIGAEIDERSFYISLNRINEQTPKRKGFDNCNESVPALWVSEPRPRFIFPDNYKKAS